MAQEVRVHLWCDRHRQADGEEVPGSTLEVTINGQTHEVEFCNECATELVEPLVEALVEYGRRQGGRGRPRQAAAPALVEAGSERGDCPKCGKNVKLLSFGAHCRKIHKQSAYEVQEETGVHLINARRPSPARQRTYKQKQTKKRA